MSDALVAVAVALVTMPLCCALAYAIRFWIARAVTDSDDDAHAFVRDWVDMENGDD